MKTKILKLAVIAMIAGVVATSCRTPQPTIQAGSVEVTTPFSENRYRSDNTHFRAVNQGSSVDHAMARRIALQNARTEMATNIGATVRAVSENYADQRQVGDRQEFQSRLQELSRTVVDQQLNDVRVIGDRTFREPNNRLTVWVAIEMSHDALMNALNNTLSRDERLRQDFDMHLFRQVFDAEMQNFQESR